MMISTAKVMLQEMSLNNKISISGRDKTTTLFCTDQEGFIGW
jgi:hypothetical protein